MEESENKKEEMQKTKVFNVIILDRSGSMESIRRAAIEGFNETLAGIRKAQEKYADTQDHFVSLVTFCSCTTNHVFDKTPVSETHPLTMEDYEPCCRTPLYDAMGFTLTDMRRYVREMADRVVVVTIITDGMENDSKEYDGKAIHRLVKELRNEGWSFTYMGANQDSIEVAISLSIRNARNFNYDHEGTRYAMEKDSNARMAFCDRLSNMKQQELTRNNVPLSAEQRNRRYTNMADEAFDEEEKNS